jgi:phenylalanyl-tRNA synthetase beta chain
MPTVAVDKLDLFHRLGREYSPCIHIPEFLIVQFSAATEEFDHLCFEFGIELDEDVRPFS